ncbi:MAG: hypothetical protein WKH64_03155 [Chloroflexia bacterium]
MTTMTREGFYDSLSATELEDHIKVLEGARELTAKANDKTRERQIQSSIVMAHKFLAEKRGEKRTHPTSQVRADRFVWNEDDIILEPLVDEVPSTAWRKWSGSYACGGLPW